MKLIILAFILSLTLHFLFFSSFEKKEEIKDKDSSSKVIRKSSVNYVKLLKKPKIEPIKKQNTEKKKKEPIKKIEKQFTKVQKKKIVPQKKVKKIKKVKQAKKRIPKKQNKNIEKKLKPVIAKNIKPQEKRKTIQKKSLENFLLKDPEPLNKDMLDAITKSYVDLYGEEYNSFTKVQKVFIQNNIKNIAQITRKYFIFPQIALRLKKADFNIVEFVLYPNGDISDLKISKKGEYAFYDKAIIEAIEIAYKDYPRPKKPTKIKFYITYKVY